MKPRLDPAPLTKEDWGIWTRPRNGVQVTRSKRLWITADRRDADLMYQLTYVRADVESMIVATNEPFRATVHCILSSGVEL